MEVPDSLIIKYFELATDEHPDTIEKIKSDLDSGKTLLDISNILVEENFVASNKELRRLVEQGGVQLNMEKVKSINVVLQENDVLKIGKKRFVKIKI